MRRCRMRTEAPVAALVPVASGVDARHDLRRDVGSDVIALGESIAALAARLHAATYELLVLLREFDARNGWNDGFLSCAH